MRHIPIIPIDQRLGWFNGNVLDTLAAFFPPHLAAHIRRCTPVRCRWRMSKFVHPNNTHHRYIIYARPAVCQALRAVCEELYEERYRCPYDPSIFSENLEEYGLPFLCILTDHAVFWCTGEVTLPCSSNKRMDRIFDRSLEIRSNIRDTILVFVFVLVESPFDWIRTTVRRWLGIGANENGVIIVPRRRR